jgi:hypothetical protein
MFARAVEFHRAMQRENLGNHTPEEIEAVLSRKWLEFEGGVISG